MRERGRNGKGQGKEHQIWTREQKGSRGKGGYHEDEETERRKQIEWDKASESNRERVMEKDIKQIIQREGTHDRERGKREQGKTNSENKHSCFNFI